MISYIFLILLATIDSLTSIVCVSKASVNSSVPPSSIITEKLKDITELHCCTDETFLIKTTVVGLMLVCDKVMT